MIELEFGIEVWKIKADQVIGFSQQKETGTITQIILLGGFSYMISDTKTNRKVLSELFEIKL